MESLLAGPDPPSNRAGLSRREGFVVVEVAAEDRYGCHWLGDDNLVAANN